MDTGCLLHQYGTLHPEQASLHPKLTLNGGLVPAFLQPRVLILLLSGLLPLFPSSLPAVGAIIGFSLVYGGGAAVNWATPDKSSFPPYKGVVPIILSWFVSPVLTGCVSALFFFMVRTLVLRRERSYQLSFWVLPVMVTFTSWIK
jgi:hypothetical protein